MTFNTHLLQNAHTHLKINTPKKTPSLNVRGRQDCGLPGVFMTIKYLFHGLPGYHVRGLKLKRKWDLTNTYT